MKTVPCFLHRWEDINPERYRNHLSFERRGGNWSNEVMALTVPDDWHVAQSNGGPLALYQDDGRHVEFVRLAAHEKSAEFASASGCCWLALGAAESACCPTCGHEM